MSLVTIVTPTYRASAETLQRCIDSVLRQSCTDFTQVVCSDGEPEPVAMGVVADYGNPRVRYSHLAPHCGDFANNIRRHWIEKADSKYIMFLDDDNFIFPEYLAVMLEGLTQTKRPFAICRIVHYGPVPWELGRPPVILPGHCKVGWIDTLQVLAETELMRKVGWLGEGYTADGVTYEALAQEAPHVRVPYVLGVHS